MAVHIWLVAYAMQEGCLNEKNIQIILILKQVIENWLKHLDFSFKVKKQKR